MVEEAGADLGADPHAALRADCGSCFGLCCVALTFTRSSDFAIDKEAGSPCPNLGAEFGCGIHSRLRDRGFPGCTVYDCFGAGQKVAQETFAGQDWRAVPASADAMFAVLPVMRQLHELLWYLAEAVAAPAAWDVLDDLRALRAETEASTHLDAPALLALDVAALRERVNDLLLRVSDVTRAEVRPEPADLRGADLIGARLRGADLRAADLRGAYLIAADLRDADLRSADLIGADLRDADLRGADLTGCLFLTQTQVNAVRGDARTRLPAATLRPSRWDATVATAPSPR